MGGLTLNPESQREIGADYPLLRTIAPREKPGSWMDALPAWYRARLNAACGSSSHVVYRQRAGGANA
ncbi:MAG: hypothetical protein ACREAC_01130, partial [Blastocatellia bacterium]